MKYITQELRQEDLISEWGRVLNNENLLPFLKLPLLVRQGLVEERISMARAAELLGVEVGEMEELAKQWAAEVSDDCGDLARAALEGKE
jgi:hypothetical protein